jgi:hypothetical protein
MPEMITVDNGPEFIGKTLDGWAHRHGLKLVFNRDRENPLTTPPLKASTVGFGMNA